MRARAFALRDGFADVLRGLGIAEEVQDHQPIRDVTPPTPPKPPAPPAEIIDAGTGEIIDPREIVTETGEDTGAVMDAAEIDYGRWFEEFQSAMDQAATAEDVAEVWNNCDPLATFEGDDDSQALAQKIKREAMLRIGGQR